MTTSLCNQSPPTTNLLVLIIPLELLLLTFIFLYPNDLKIQSYLSACRAAAPASAVSDFIGIGPVAVKPDFRLLIGVLTHPDSYERRQLVRLVYSLKPPGLAAHIDVRFVFCNLTSDEQEVLVALEIMLHDDIIILDCRENMNFGKTYHYFSSLPKLLDRSSGGGRPYDYVMKMDDDTYFRLDSLAESLRGKPREDMYYGLEIPCKGEKFPPFPAPFMTGMGYVLSWDLVEWVAASEIARNHTIGPEDMLVGMWLSMGGRGKNWYGMGRAMYNYKGWNESTNCFRHELAPDTVAVHMLKNNSRWANTLRYFNVTRGLNPGP
ncbi:putative beta-1,3-galactosyltransferase 16 [Ananas comosus]|uniref:Hexosyltransferase n=2 Tax=Ananas comosus TaxID=4615 RepID=A0A199VMB1_ANACO|nr:putative beta-1,3-galactosyltransferase 16 [Ananas comosus]